MESGYHATCHALTLRNVLCYGWFIIRVIIINNVNKVKGCWTGNQDLDDQMKDNLSEPPSCV